MTDRQPPGRNGPGGRDWASADDSDTADLSRPGSKAGKLQRALLDRLAVHERENTLATSARFLFYELVQAQIVSKAQTVSSRVSSGNPRPRDEAPLPRIGGPGRDGPLGLDSEATRTGFDAGAFDPDEWRDLIDACRYLLARSTRLRPTPQPSARRWPMNARPRPPS
ncbi:MAG: hypothetical protein WBR28_13440 [Mycobacterium sp.]